MALHEQSVGATDEWYTPEHVFAAMATTFDLDPCPGPVGTPARGWCGVNERVGPTPWFGTVWLNPPFDLREGASPAQGTTLMARGKIACAALALAAAQGLGACFAKAEPR